MKINFQNLKNSQFFINFKINFRNGIFQKYFFSDGFFSTIFFPVRIFWGCRFDAEIGPLSIYRVCKAIPALLHLVWSQFMHLGGCSRNIWGSYGLRKFLVYTKCYLLPKIQSRRCVARTGVEVGQRDPPRSTAPGGAVQVLSLAIKKQ